MKSSKFAFLSNVVGMIGEMVNKHKTVITNLKKKTLSRTRHRWGDHIKMDLKEVRHDNVDYIHLVGTVINEPS